MMNLFSVLLLSAFSLDIILAGSDWRVYISTLVWNALNTDRSDILDSLHNIYSQYGLNTRICRLPLNWKQLPTNREIVPCGQIYIDWRYDRMTQIPGSMEWDILIIQESFSVHLTLTTVNLADSLKDCRNEGIEISTVEGNFTKRGQRYCGVLEDVFLFPNTNNLTMKYYITPSLSAARSGKLDIKGLSSQGYFHAVYDVFSPNEIIGKTPRFVLDAPPPPLGEYYNSIAINGSVPLADFSYQQIRGVRHSHAIIKGELGQKLYTSVIHPSLSTPECLPGPDYTTPALYPTGTPDLIGIPRTQIEGYIKSLVPGKDSVLYHYPGSSLHFMSLYVTLSVIGSCLVDPGSVVFAFLVDVSGWRDSQLITKLQVAEDGLKLSLPQNLETCKVGCVLDIETEPGFYIDVFVERYISSGPNPGCHYHGLIVYKWGRETPKDVKLRVARGSWHEVLCVSTYHAPIISPDLTAVHCGYDAVVSV